MIQQLLTQIEAIIFSADQPVLAEDLRVCFEKVTGRDVQSHEINYLLEELSDKYNADEYAFALCKINGGYQFMTKQAHHEVVRMYLNREQPRRLSTAALEVLSIVAYKQPVEKTDVEKIRGVNCDYTLQKLLEKELIKIVGRSDSPGRPILYGTGELFMEYFGINSPSDLPKLKDIDVNEENKIGIPEFAFQQTV